ncbi:MAG TPA: phosphoglycerate kinase, partial [Alphaproteobacteria bacterium]|nr:phosphoglycerate kinase [Alphaproteobacteria bacterium]
MPQMQQLKDIKNLSHKTVIVRADFNVPLDKGMVTDASRINRGSATIQYLLQQKAKVVIISHLGRPDGHPNPAYSLQHVIPSLKKSLHGHDVFFVDDCVGTKVEEKVKGLKNGQALLLENLRFYAAEEKNDPLFAQKLALLGDIYVNDAFSCAHRAHASIDRITRLLPSVAGLLLSEEINALEQILHNPKRPLIAIVGGAKISSKLLLLQNLLSKVDYLVVGGAMANTFLLGQGYKIGKSLVEPTMVATALDVKKLAANTRKT